MGFIIFATYWILIFLNNYLDYVVSAVAINYFFRDQYAHEITDIHIVCHVLSHNIGTIAWSIILLPAMILKIPFLLTDRWLSKNEGGLAKCINLVFCPCCWLYEKLIDRFNESYFAISYLGSYDFWRSTSIAYYLKEAEEGDERVTQAIDLGMIFQFISKILISICTLVAGK